MKSRLEEQKWVVGFVYNILGIYPDRNFSFIYFIYFRDFGTKKNRSYWFIDQF